MKYRALILDLDGTTIPNKIDALPNARVVEAIRKATQYVTVSTATGRPLFLLKKLFEVIPFNGPCIINNGTQIYDPIEKRVIHQILFSHDDIPKLITLCEKYTIPIYINYVNKPDVLYDGGYIQGDILSLFITGLTKVQCELIITECKSIPSVYYHKIASWKPGFFDIEFSSVNASKLHGIQYVANRLGISTHEIIGVGDSYNDFSLLMACGFKIAMGNAVPELKAIADFTAPTVDEDGVATIIEKFILEI